MRRKNNYLVAVANNGKLRLRFTPGVPRIFDQDCTYISFKVTLHDEICFARLASVYAVILVLYIFYLKLFIIHLKAIYLKFSVKKAK